MDTLTLYGEAGWGSAIVESQLAWYGDKYDFVALGNVFDDTDARSRILEVNPLGQIPTLILSDGRVMTESAAITLFLADRHPRKSLVPDVDHPSRPDFLRWLLFITSNIYPTYTYADVPTRFVENRECAGDFAEAVFAYARKLYRLLDAAAKRPWFLGESLSAIDFYIGTMTHWRPGEKWFNESTPLLAAISRRVVNLPELRDVWARNFPAEANQESP